MESSNIKVKIPLKCCIIALKSSCHHNGNFFIFSAIQEFLNSLFIKGTCMTKHGLADNTFLT